MIQSQRNMLEQQNELLQSRNQALIREISQLLQQNED